MSTTIEETVRTELTNRGQSSYISYATPVIAKLTEREIEISDQLLTLAGDLGADPDDVKVRLVELGMAVPADPEPEPEDEDDEEGDDSGQILSALREINRQLESLTRFARSNGYTG